MAFSRQRPAIAAIAACVSLLTFVLLRGCQTYGPVSDSTYDHATALFSICNRRDAVRLEAFDDLLRQSRASGAIDTRGADMLSEVVLMARNDEWNAASEALRVMLMEQVTD